MERDFQMCKTFCLKNVPSPDYQPAGSAADKRDSGVNKHFPKRVYRKKTKITDTERCGNDATSRVWRINELIRCTGECTAAFKLARYRVSAEHGSSGYFSKRLRGDERTRPTPKNRDGYDIVPSVRAELVYRVFRPFSQKSSTRSSREHAPRTPPFAPAGYRTTAQSIARI